MKNILNFNEFTNEAVEYEYSTIQGKRIVSNWAGRTNKESEFIKLIKDLPITLESIKVPNDTRTYEPPKTIFKGPITNTVKNNIIKLVKGMTKKFNNEENPILEYSIKGNFGVGDLEEHQTHAAHITFITRSSNQFSKNMSSGKYGSLD